jgi:hypothetical protein
MEPHPVVTSRLTRHFLERATARRLPPEVADFIMLWGTERRAAGATHLTLLRRNLPPELWDGDQARRAFGWILVMSTDGQLLTCYHRKDAWKFLRRKSDRRRGAHLLRQRWLP